jgi:predicted transcriptional regulator
MIKIAKTLCARRFSEMFKLSEAELDTMLMLWECSEPIRPSELLVLLNNHGHSWSISTLQTLLARLMAKGAVEITYQKRFHYYAPSLSREAFLIRTAKYLLGRLNTYSPLSLTKALEDEGILLTKKD